MRRANRGHRRRSLARRRVGVGRRKRSRGRLRIARRCALLALRRTQVERFLHTLHARHDFGLDVLRSACVLRTLRLRGQHRRGRQHLVERLLRGSLLRCPPARAGARHLHVELRHRAFDLELLIVRRTMRRDDRVGRQRDLVALQVLLQQRLRVLAERARIDVVENRDIEALDDPLGGFEAAIEEYGPDDGFERVREDRRAAEAATAQLALAQPQPFGDIQGLSDFIQRLLLDEIGAHARQVAFVQLAETLEQKGGHRAIQNGIAEKLEPFVMRGTVTAVGQSLAQQFRIAKFVAQPAFQLGWGHVQEYNAGADRAETARPDAKRRDGAELPPVLKVVRQYATRPVRHVLHVACESNAIS
ncbi:hypothetical protein BamIOP4010DRAFT_3320 [Burkholderia ambifaria IOP40-10]|uniref:Uncharacterized protein n=1 Tax=Burkholderia ambifaria IOP40-10 TaxID=396596 RepID=B1FH10_9BURK|nr:hypothetical protein BamIOP4010DRAFT_3320 [Burkholderia ambifaria IOP40-10]